MDIIKLLHNSKVNKIMHIISYAWLLNFFLISPALDYKPKLFWDTNECGIK